MRIALLALALTGSATAGLAQSIPSWARPSEPPAPVHMDPGDGPGTPDDPGPPEVPIDGGLGLLAAAGAAYAARRLRNRA